jgi:hypothetical protein
MDAVGCESLNLFGGDTFYDACTGFTYARIELRWKRVGPVHRFTIVKHADDESWKDYWEIDPKIRGVKCTHSAFFTHVGKYLEIKIVYENLAEALEDLARMKKNNPNAGYAICPLRTCDGRKNLPRCALCL